MSGDLRAEFRVFDGSPVLMFGPFCVTMTPEETRDLAELLERQFVGFGVPDDVRQESHPDFDEQVLVIEWPSKTALDARRIEALRVLLELWLENH